MPSTARSTPASTPRLSEAARHLVFPSTIVESAFPRVERRLASVGYSFDPWQQGFGTISLGVDAAGKYAATVGGVVASIPRQVGKTYTIGGLLVGLALEFPGLRAIWTSHHLRTTTATFRSMQGIVRKPKLAPHIAENDRGGMAIRTANGEQEIRFKNGSLIMFGARAQGFGRGMAAIDVEVFDEAQILSLKALEDMVPATNQARNPHGGLLFFIGTPPRPDDDGEAFLAKRQQALSGNSDDDMVFVELSADSDADLMDRDQWRRANPSYPHRTPHSSMLRMRKNIPDDGSWRREALGIWDEVVGAKALIEPAAWKAGHREIAPPAGVQAFGVKFSPDGQRVSLAGARRPDGGPTHVEVIKAMSRSAGTVDLADWIAARWRKAAVIVVDGKSGADQFVTALVKRGVPRRRIVVPTLSQVYEAHSGLLEAVRTGELTHYGQVGLDAVVKSATKRDIGKDGGWGWQAISDDVDVTPLEAVTYAHFGATTTKRKPSGDGERASSSGRRAVVA